MIRKLAAVPLLIALLAPMEAYSADFEKGLAAAQRGDYQTALQEWRPLAEQGNAGAQYNLGVAYSNGEGVPQDYAEAAKWYRMAAEQGAAGAQFNLGLLYSNGEGVSQDYAEAAKWFRMAAEQGVADAQFNLGVMYANGDGVPQDYVKAYMWLNLAAARGKSEDKKSRDTVAGWMTPAEIQEAQRLAREWFDKHQ